MSGQQARRFSNFIFAGLFAVSVVLLWRIMAPFVMPVLLGAFLVVLFIPLQDFLVKRLHLRCSWAAGLSTLAVVLLILVPLGAVAWLVAREVFGIAGYAQDLLDQVDLRRDLLAQLPRGIRRYLPAGAEESPTGEALLGLITGGAGMVTRLVGAGTELVIHMFLMAVSVYYFFIDGRRLYGELTRLLPMDPRYMRAFAQDFRDVAYAIMYGNSLTALVQGLVGFIGLLLAGVPHAPVWALAMTLLSLIPIGGTALVWLPIGLVLLLTKRYADGVLLLAWGGLIVSTLDNVLRPRLTGARMQLHPLLVFLSIFGGLAVFGMMGLLVGPLIASIFMAMVRIYRRDFLGDGPRTAAPLVQDVTA